ncbi:MAG: helix-turn-helix transcriptional regulator [Anaerolineales bacterium]|nr:helix-turn-helix transcriptional regulator [Anaerolineales bacterium]
MTTTAEKQTEKLILELRRGVIVMAVLSRLQREHYGYSLRQDLADSGLDINEGTLYPLLRRLEDQGLLESRWDVSESRPRRYYKIAKPGLETLLNLKEEWKYLGVVMAQVLSDER